MVPVSEILCPIGPHDDHVFKVSAIYRGGIAESRKSAIGGNFGSGFSLGVDGGSGRSQTKLSATLAPPTKSRVFRSFSWLLYVYSVPIDFILLALIIGAISSGQVTSPAGLSTETRGEIYAFLLIAVIFACTLALNIDDARRAKWKTQRQLWNQLYYCFRHDVVFLPDSEPVSVEEMGPFLHQAAHEEESTQPLP